MQYGDKGTAVKALQKDLAEAGFSPGKIDAFFGPQMAAALAAYASARFAEARLPAEATGRAEALPGTPTTPRWLTVAQGEIGQREINGAAHNPRILAYQQATSLRATDDETPWCAAFVCWCLEEAGIESTRSSRARSFTSWGRKLVPSEVGPGAVVVFWRGRTRNEGKGHVGFYVGGAPTGTRIAVLGGNQSDSVKIGAYSTDRVLGYYWPENTPLPAPAQVAAAHAMTPGAAMKMEWA
jgi:uncharacterized protein (TIGR02594 family)